MSLDAYIYLSFYHWVQAEKDFPYAHPRYWSSFRRGCCSGPGNNRIILGVQKKMLNEFWGLCWAQSVQSFPTFNSPNYEYHRRFRWTNEKEFLPCRLHFLVVHGYLNTIDHYLSIWYSTFCNKSLFVMRLITSTKYGRIAKTSTKFNPFIRKSWQEIIRISSAIWFLQEWGNIITFLSGAPMSLRTYSRENQTMQIVSVIARRGLSWAGWIMMIMMITIMIMIMI